MIGRNMKDAGLVLLDLCYHPFHGHVITVVTESEMCQLQELKYDDFKLLNGYG